MTSVLFVCLGNICRSPTAEAVFRTRAKAAGLTARIDSAGTGGWHQGEPPDPRMQRAAKKRGYDLAPIRARKFDDGDGYAFDHVIAMDESNLADLRERQLPDWTATIRMLLDNDVPDPYYGGTDGFETVIDLIEQGVDDLIRELKNHD